MKKLTKNVVLKMWCQIIVVCIFSSQTLNRVNALVNSNSDHLPSDSTIDASRHDRKLNANSNFVEDEECKMCNLSEMPMELAEKINEIDDMDVFVHDFVDTTNSLSNISSLTAHPAVNRKRRAVGTQLRQATCQPIDSLVSLVPPEEKDPTIFYFPSCIILKQCGGCCAHSGTTCTPIDETERQITVKKTKFVNDPKFANLGDVTMTIKEHNKCKCLCKKTASDCSSLQKFIKSQCRCDCLNSKDADECAQDPKKLFDTKSCVCVCRETKECSSGFSFDHGTCSCQPITDDIEEVEDEYSLHFGDHLHNETYEAMDEIKYDTATTSL